MRVCKFMKAELKRRFGVIILFVSFASILFILLLSVSSVGKKIEKESLETEASFLVETAEVFSINLLDENICQNLSTHNEISSNISISDKENIQKIEASKTAECQTKEESNQIERNKIEEKRLKSLQIQKDSASNKLTLPSFSGNNYQNNSNDEYNDKIKVSASCGISPIYFLGNSFINSYFPKQTFILLPCLSFSIVFPSKTKWKWGLIFQGTGSKLEHITINYSDNLDLIMSTQLFTFQSALLLEKNFLSSQNLFEVHVGLGISSFFNSSCQIGKVKSNPLHSATFFLNCGLSLKHNFTKNIFCNLSFNFNYAFSPAEAFIFLEPSITGGVLI